MLGVVMCLVRIVKCGGIGLVVLLFLKLFWVFRIGVGFDDGRDESGVEVMWVS